MSSPALVLIDLQEDFLSAPQLLPPRSFVVGRAAALLSYFRAAGLPVWHVITTLHEPEERMAHWKRSGRFSCRNGTAGHAIPAPLAPLADEPVIHKKRFSGFFGTGLYAQLRERGVDTVVLAGVHLHSCVRATALDAYQHDLRVFIASDAVGSDDPPHAAATERYLAERTASFADSEALPFLLDPSTSGSSAPLLPTLRISGQVDGTPPDNAGQEILRPCPSRKNTILWRLRSATAGQVATATAQAAAADWRKLSPKARRQRIAPLADRLTAAAETLAQRTAIETGKPIVAARGEIEYARQLLSATLREHTREHTRRGDGWRAIRAPLGVIAALTPFNNPVASFIGKAVPALLFGNTLVWKPAPAASGVALALFQLFDKLEMPQGSISLICGDTTTATALLERPEIAAISLTGGPSAGFMAQTIAAARSIPLQAELGGNNAAIVLADADLASAARAIVRGAFGSGGQRCTANRRVIVQDSIYEALRQALLDAAGTLGFGDPLDEATELGPLISARALERTELVLADAEARGQRLLYPRGMRERAALLQQQGFYHPPVLVECQDPDVEIVREETFGPVLVLQRAAHLEQALALLAAPRQGLSAALFTRSRQKMRTFLQRTRTGLLKLNQGTTGGIAAAPFGGWGSSGIGPAEHGPADAEFFGRWQTICQDPEHVR